MTTTRPQVMGIINVTPDSFSGDGIAPYDDYIARAVAQAHQMVIDGADILDVGGESSRPGSVPVSAGEEIRRVVPVIEAILNLGVPIAVDTVKADVAEVALQAGADIINDVSALNDPRMAAVVSAHKADIVLMHNRAGAAAQSATIGGAFAAPLYADFIQDVSHDLSQRVQAALEAGIARDKIILDPGVGFGKTPQQNAQLIAHLPTFKKLGFPILMGVSRKSFIGAIMDVPVDARLEGTAACITACIMLGADIVRVHDVKFMARIVKMATALRDAA